MNKMRPETSNNSKTTSSTNSCSTDDDNSYNNDHDQRIGAYCTLRSNKSNDLKHQQLNDNFETNKIDLKNHYCTISKRLKDLIKTEPIDCNSLVYKKLQDQISNEQRTSQSSSINNFGLSNNLSTESIKNACDYFELTDDDDDDDLIVLNDQKKHVEAVNNSLLEKLENRFSNIKRSSLSRQSTKSVTFDRKKKLDHFHPYCTIRRDKNPIITNSTIENKQINNSCLLTTIYPIINNDRDSVNNDLDVINESSIKYHNQDSIEAFNILSELDAILDNHDEKLQITSLTPSSISPYHNEPEKIEDCLLELDAYLEGIDDSISINSNNHELDIFKEIPSNNNQILEQENQTNINKRQFQRSRTLPKKIIRSRSRKNVPNNLVNSFVNPQYDHQQMENLKGLEHHHEEIHDNALNMDLKRQHKFRNTIDVPRRSKIDREDDHSSDILKDKSPIERQKSWRRNSMRKTSLLKLPDHKQNNTILKNDISSQLTNFNKSKLEYGESSTISSPNLIDNSLQTINLNRISNSIPNLNATSIDDITINKNINKLEENRINNSINYNNNNNNNINNNQTNNNNLLENINSTESNHNNNDLSNSLSQVESNQRQDLSHIDIINDILNNSLSSDTNQTLPARPRQFGRRAQANPRVVSIMAETNEAGNQRIIINHDRPISAPATAITNQNICTDERTTSLQLVTSQQAPNNARYIGSEPSSVGSSRNPSPVSLLSSTASSSMGSGEPEQTTTESQDQRTDSPDETPNNITNGNSIQNNNNSQWPHGFSRILALLCCTLGLFNISRFAIITIHYGGSFLIQFVFLSIIFGIPMLWLQMCLGTKIKSGPITMWKISPICKGIGISLLLVQFCIAIYSTISLGWILIYFRDSFVTRNDRYRWQDTLSIYRGQSNITDITKNLIDYFNGMVLQRWELSAKDNVDSGGVRFQLAFNLAVIWTFVFIILCKGLQSFGKIVLGLTLLPMILFIIVCSKLLYLIDITTVQNIYNSSDFDTFLTDSKSWAAAAQESFLTWGWLGSSVIAISSKSAEKSEGKTILRRDAFLVVILTFFGLTLSALLGYACIRILNDNGYAYMPGSYENLKCGQFISALEPGTYLNFVTIPGKWSPHYSSIMGDTYMITNRQLGHSGYQSLRLITELFPATLSIATQEQISPVWCIMGYLMFLLFGLAQLCAMWKPITNILGNSIPSTLISCITGFLLGIPFATEYGIQIIYYLEIVIGGSWWILVLWTGHILGIFLIRGRPYTSDIIVGDLNVYAHLQAFLGLSWNLLLPIGLITLSIIEYKLSYSNELYNWRRKGYFQLWTRKIGSLVQITFLLLIPIVAIIQIYRYLSKGPPDLLDRIQLLYRPIPTPPPHRRNRSNIERYPLPQVAISLTNLESQVQDDAPPKYTPPPSYTTATGARIAKMLRQSIRRSVRRILGGGETSRQRPTISTGSIPIHDTALPPEYSTVLSNPSGDDAQPEIGPRILYNSYTQRTLSLERNCPNDYPISLRSTSPSSSLSSQFLRQNNNDNDNNNKTNRIQGNRNAQTFTAFDVAQILRSSQRHQRSASAIATRMDNAIRCSSLRYNNNKNSRSVENLVLNAAPLGESNAITLSSETPNNDENTSVI